MIENNRPADFEVRQQALDVEHSYAVAAPAGSGKTGLLTLRLLKLLCRCNKPEDILCITFTRKAAAEMRERLLGALARARQPLSSDASEHERMTHGLASQVLERDATLNWQLESMPGRLRIQTIDSFCRSLASQLPIASALGAELATLDTPEKAYRLAVGHLLDDFANGRDDQADLETLIAHLDNQLDRLENLLVSLLARRDQWIGRLYELQYSQRELLEANLREWGEELVVQVVEEMAPFAGELLDCIRYATDNLSREDPDHPLMALQDLAGLPGDSDEEILNQWQPLIGLLLTNDNGWRKQINKKSGFPAGTTKEEKAYAQRFKQKFQALLEELKLSPCLLESLQELRAFPGSRYTDEQWRLLNSLTRVLPRLVAQLKLVFRQFGATDFVEITEAALTALGSAEDPTDLALKLDYQIQHILVDEFQDTSTPQLELLEKLTEGWQPDDGRTLFVVGDGMQSCYGFRDANVGIFLDLRERGLNTLSVQPLDLSVNFRSRAGVVAWVNRVFAQAFPSTDNIGRGAVSYAPSKAFDTTATESCVTCVGFPDQQDYREEAQYIRQQIERLRKRAPSDTIAVLVRGRSHLLELVPALQAAGIPYRAVDIDPLLSRMAIVDLLSLTRALLDPTDRIAWLSILRAPWCGLSMTDLHALVTEDLGDLNSAPRERNFADIPGQIHHFEAVQGLSAEGRESLARLRTQLDASLAQRRRKPLRQWVEGTWIALGGPAAVPTEAERRDVQTFLALLEKHERAGTIEDWREFEDALGKLYAQAPDTEANPVELMTIHKSKGLEFDHVFLPGLDRRTRGDDPPLLLWHQRLTASHEKTLVLSPITAVEEEQAAPLYRFLQREKKLKNRLEETRLLYVACTRAKKNLWLTANLQRDKNDAIKAPMDSCLLARIWNQVEPDLHVVEQAIQQEPEMLNRSTSRIARLPADWQLPEPDFSAPLADYRAPEYDNTDLEDSQEDSFHNREARHRGTLWHRLLCQLAKEGLDAWTEDRVERHQPFWRAQARQLGLPEAKILPLLQEFAATIRALRTDSQARWLFDRTHPHSHCELPLTSREAERMLILDRTFVYEGTRWIVDYKTAVPDQGQSLNEFLRQECMSYRQQLRAYGRALAEMEDLPQVLALYFPLIRHLERLEPQEDLLAV